MNRMLASGFMALVPLLCNAEVPAFDVRQPQKDGVVLVGMECHHRRSTLELGIFLPANPPSKRMDLWNTADFARFNPGSSALEGIETVERKCGVGGKRYRIRLTGIPGAGNAMWACGASTGIHASVWRNDRIVFDDDLYKCKQDDYIKRILFRNGTDAPEIERRN